jgi:hypothetical protein
MALVTGSDGKAVPQGFQSRPTFAQIRPTGAVVLTTPTAATTFAGANMAAGLADPATNDGGFIVAATAGTITAPRAMRARVRYSLSNITVVNGQVITAEVFVNATASGGRCIQTQLTAAPCQVAGEVIVTLAAGDVVALRIIGSTGNFTADTGFILVEEV